MVSCFLLCGRLQKGLEYRNTKKIEVCISNGLVLEWLVIEIAKAMVPTIPKPNHWKSKHIILKIVLGQDSPSLELYYLNF